MDARISKLVAIANLQRDIDLNKLSELSNKRRDLEAINRTLQQKINTRNAQMAASNSFDFAQLMGADLAWRRWLEIDIGQRRAQILKLAIEQEAQLEISKKSFGRASVLDKISSAQ